MAFVKVFISFFFGFILFSNYAGYIGYSIPDYNDKNSSDTVKLHQDFRNAILQHPDTIIKSKIKYESDTSFTQEKYAEFLEKILDGNKYRIVTQDQFNSTIDPTKVIISLRHDMDADINRDFEVSKIEKDLGIRSTYFVLHTASYYLKNPDNKAIHNESILPFLKKMQNEFGHEIGWHNDLVTLQLVYKIDPIEFLKQELKWLRDNSIVVKGTASHGSSYCYTYKYLNYYFFDECKSRVVGQFVNNEFVVDGPNTIYLKHGKLSDFNLEYEAYFLNFNKYFSDASTVNGQRWHIGMLDLNSLQPGDRVVILTHPYLYHKASTKCEIVGFFIKDQKKCIIDPIGRTIDVEMPYGTDCSKLTPSFDLSSGAYAMVQSKKIMSGVTNIDFNNPIRANVVAENRRFSQDWTITVKKAKNDKALIESFIVPNFTNSVSIDPTNSIIAVKVNSSANLSQLPIKFTLSGGARAWIGEKEQFSDVGTVDFTNPVDYKVVADDGLTTNFWNVSVTKEDDCQGADILSFSTSGAIKPVKIDYTKQAIEVKVDSKIDLTSLVFNFELSCNSQAYVNNVLQVSGVSANDFSNPVEYRVVSEKGTEKKWIISVLKDPSSGIGSDLNISSIQVYPNPSNGRFTISFEGIESPSTIVNIYSITGTRVYSKILKVMGDFSHEVDLGIQPAGIYFIKINANEKVLSYTIQIMK